MLVQGIKSLLVGGVSAVAVGSAFSAQAAEQPTQVSSAAASSQAAVAPSPVPPASVSVSEVVVTAERRPNTLQRTPTAVQVFSGAELENRGVQTVDELQFLAPSVTLLSFGIGNDFNIRGLG